MFGLLYMASNAIAYLFSWTKTSYDDYCHKQDAIKNERNEKVKTNTYTDHRGCTRDIVTNGLRYTNKDHSTGDIWLEDVNGKKIRNLSQEKRNIEFEENKRNNPDKRAIKYTVWDHNTTQIKDMNEWFRLEETIYKDVNNGDLYIIRNNIEWQEDLYRYDIFNNYEGNIYRANFYMRVKDGFLVGLNDDEQPKPYKTKYHDYVMPDNEEIERFIQFFNQKQKEGGWKHSKERDSGKEVTNYKSDYYLC